MLAPHDYAALLTTTLHCLSDHVSVSCDAQLIAFERKRAADEVAAESGPRT